MSTTAVTPSEQWRTSGPRGVISYLVRVPEDCRPNAGAKSEVSLRVSCTKCKHVALLGSAWTYRYSVFLHALSVSLLRSALCEHDENRFFEFTKE